MEAGAEAIYQGALHDGAWAGRADFLLRVPQPSALGPWSYDIADAKLAVAEKAAFLVQLGVYADLVAALQGRLPSSVRALLGDGREVRYDPARTIAYVRAARARFERRIGSLDPAAVPDRVGACEGCVWFERCDERRRGVDHLSQVAGMRRAQIVRLGESGVTTLAGLALAPDGARPRRTSEPSFVALRRQAALQLEQRVDGVPRYELLPPRERAGFALLPPPAAGDVYLDAEIDPLFEPGRSLVYLLGAYVHDAGQRRYRPFWSETRAQERSRLRGLRRLAGASTAAPTPPRTSTTTDPTTRARCGGWRCSTARARTRSTTCCAARSGRSARGRARRRSRSRTRATR